MDKNTLPNPEQLRTMARPQPDAQPCVPGRFCARRARDLGACIAGECNPPASSDGVVVGAETQSPPEGGDCLDVQKATREGCPCKQSNCATALRSVVNHWHEFGADGMDELIHRIELRASRCNPPGRAEGVEGVEGGKQG
jgi:hypothetical protein